MATKAKPGKREKPARKSKSLPKLDARRDTLDFRDRMYVPALIEVPTFVDLESYRGHAIPILDQGVEGACTGFGLATVANYLLTTRKVVRDCSPVSPRMLYEMARRHDEWPGEKYAGSSARGAMKGWHKHGVCEEAVWPYRLKRGGENGFTAQRAQNAQMRPLGAYFRVNHQDLVAVHAALAEVGVLFATADVHAGWADVGADGDIRYTRDVLGAHAFAIVAYDEKGLWIQNSWGTDWGAKGFARISYDDWLEHASDVWVARLGAPVVMRESAATATAHSATAGESKAYSFRNLRPHIISIGNDGALKAGGNYGTSADDVRTLFRDQIPAAMKDRDYQHILLYAHGGLVGEATAVQRLADYRSAMMDAGIYPLSFIWYTDYWNTVKNVLQDAFGKRRPEGPLDAAKDFMLDRLDDALEPIARSLSGRMVWREMKENALRASAPAGGATLVVKLLAQLLADKPLKVHVVGHSAGSIFHAPLVTALARARIPIDSCTLWAPACTLELFKRHYAPLLESGGIHRMAIFALSDDAEQNDHCASIYHKSLLYLVSNSFEDRARIPLVRGGEPLLGMQKFIEADEEVVALVKRKKLELIFTPNAEAGASNRASDARHHGDFDDDKATVRSTLARMLNQVAKTEAQFSFKRSASSLKARRRAADPATAD